MRHKFISFFSAAALGALIIGQASARPDGQRGRPHPGPPMELFEPLNLDSERLALIEEIHQNTEERLGELRPQLQGAEEALRTLLNGDEPDRDAIVEQVEIIESFRATNRLIHIDTMLDVRSLLTDDERTLLDALREARKDCRQGRRDHRPRPRKRHLAPDRGAPFE